MKQLIIDIGTYISKIAYLNDEKLEDIFIQDRENTKLEGNIYKGIVKKVLKGMDSAFVEIGEEKNAYLSTESKTVKQGEHLLVQVKKEPIEDKGAKISMNVSIPGRYLVITNDTTDIKISNKIKCQEEQKRLKDILENIKPKDIGIIIRTQGENKSKEEFEKDLTELLNIWEFISKEKELGFKSKLLYKREDFIIKTIKNLVNDEFDKIIVNDFEEYNKIKKYLKSIDINLTNKVSFFDEGIDIFDYFKIKKDFENLLENIVYLKNGSYLIIERTKALTVIDVNSGGYIGVYGLDKTVHEVNLMAAKEIANQIRLRDIGGIIIVDFIDMKDDSKKHSLLQSLQSHLDKDRDKAKVLGMTSLGLVEIVRRKKSICIDEYFKEDCLNCSNGRVYAKNYILDKIEKEISRIKSHTNIKDVVIGINSSEYEKGIYEKNIEKIKDKYDINIEFKICKNILQKDIKVYLKNKVDKK